MYVFHYADKTESPVPFQRSFAAHFSLKDRSQVRKTMRKSSSNENAQQRGAFWQEEALPMPPGRLLDNTYYLNFAGFSVTRDVPYTLEYK